MKKFMNSLYMSVLFFTFLDLILIVSGGDNIPNTPNPVMDFLSYWIGPVFAYILMIGLIIVVGLLFVKHENKHAYDIDDTDL